MRTLIFGARGQLGRDLIQRFGQLGGVQGHDLPEMDVARPGAALEAARAFSPMLIVNAAAYTDVEGAEDDREGAFRVNETGAQLVAEAAAELSVPVVYYSTDFVFPGGQYTPYEVDTAVLPRGVYAKSKAAGEVAVRAATPNHYIVRTAWLYGPGGNCFPEKILRAAQSRPCLRVVDDEVGSPTHTYDLAEATAALVQSGRPGAYHAVNEGACSRFELAKEVLRIAGVETPIEPCKASEFPSKAPRPDYSVLSNRALREACGYTMRDWRAALEHYMTRRSET